MPAKSCMRRRSSAVNPSPPPRLSSCSAPNSVPRAVSGTVRMLLVVKWGSRSPLQRGSSATWLTISALPESATLPTMPRPSGTRSDWISPAARRRTTRKNTPRFSSSSSQIELDSAWHSSSAFCSASDSPRDRSSVLASSTPISSRTSSSLRGSSSSPSLIEAGRASEAAPDPEGGLEAVGEGLLTVPDLGEVPVEVEAQQVGGEPEAVGRLGPADAVGEVVRRQAALVAVPALHDLAGVAEPAPADVEEDAAADALDDAERQHQRVDQREAQLEVGVEGAVADELAVLEAAYGVEAAEEEDVRALPPTGAAEEAEREAGAAGQRHVLAEVELRRGGDRTRAAVDGGELVVAAADIGRVVALDAPAAARDRSPGGLHRRVADQGEPHFRVAVGARLDEGPNLAGLRVDDEVLEVVLAPDVTQRRLDAVVEVEGVDEEAGGAADAIGGAPLQPPLVGDAEEEGVGVEECCAPLEPPRQVHVNDVEVGEARHRVELQEQPLVTQVIGEGELRLRDDEPVRGDADAGVAVLEEELEAAVVFLVLVVDGDLDVGLVALQRRFRGRRLVGDVGDRLDERRLLVEVAAVEVEAALPVADVDEGTGAVDALHHLRHEAAGDGVGVLAHLPGGEIERVDILGAVAIGSDEQRVAVLGERGVDVVLVAAGELAAGGRVLQLDAEELLELPHLRAVDDALAVGGEHRAAVEALIVGEVGRLAALDVEQEDVEPAGLVAREGDALAVGAPRRRERLLHVEVDDALDAAVDDVDEHQAAPLLALGEDRQPVAVGREGEVGAAPAPLAEVLAGEVLVLR